MKSSLSRRALLGLAGLGVVGGATGLSGCSPAQQNRDPGPAPTGSSGQVSGTVSVRLWDEQVKKAYDESFAALKVKNPGLTVTTTLVPYSDYFTKLRTDVSGGNADDIWMLNGSYLDPYVTSKSIAPIGAEFDDLKNGWIQPAIDQYTRQGQLQGVPQLTDGGIAMYYNAELLKAAGVTPEQAGALSWGTSDDSFLATVKKLTVDANGKRGDEAGFDGTKPGTWGYCAAQDLQGIYYNFLGSAGGQFQDADNQFVFDSPEGVTAFTYIVDLINKHRVSPAASNTNANGDFTRDQFLQGKIALFQSGIYNLKNVSDGAKFEWGVVAMPTGPAGRISVVNNVVVVANAASLNAAATREVLRWLGSGEGASFIGKAGAALSAVSAAQSSFTEFWSKEKVDPAPFAKQGEGHSIAAPAGPNYGAALEAWKPSFDEMFLGRKPVAEALKQAQAAANEAMNG